MAKPRFTDAELRYLVDVLIERVGRTAEVYFRDRKGQMHAFCPDCQTQLTAEHHGHAKDCPQTLRYSVLGKIEAWQEREKEE